MAQPTSPDCDYDPRELAGLPIGTMHCPRCGEMVIAGLPHEPEVKEEDYDDDQTLRAE
jgi:hypothetical protein